MYQEIAVAKGPEYDRLNQKMDRCQENIETLSDEIQRCQGKCVVRDDLFVVIFCLAKTKNSKMQLQLQLHLFLISSL